MNQFLLAPLIIAAVALLAPSHALAENEEHTQKVVLCHAGIVKLQSFEDHIRKLRSLDRYDPDQIKGLIAAQHRGGAEFFSSQIAVKEEVSGSGMYDLRTFHGLYNARDYRNVSTWTCEGEDYPIVYFVGFMVEKIADNTIFVARAKEIVNVISLKPIDADLDKHLKVKLSDSNKVLCDDLAKSCAPEIFYDNGW